MNMYPLVVAALLLTGDALAADAAKSLEQPSKSAQKVLAVLNALGMNNQQVKSLVQQADRHLENRKFNFIQQDVAGGRLSLRYRFDKGMLPQRAELAYGFRNSPTEITANNKGIAIQFKMKF